MTSTKKESESSGLPAAEPVTLAELVSYQDGSIVSRTLLPTGSLNWCFALLCHSYVLSRVCDGSSG